MERKRLEEFLRHDEVVDDLVFLLRGGVHGEVAERLQSQAGDFNRRFCYQESDCYGISVFAATAESESWVLARSMSVRRRYYRIRYTDIAQLQILPTFTVPHWTVLFSGPDGADYSYFMDALGELRDNRYWSRKPGRRPK